MKRDLIPVVVAGAAALTGAGLVGHAAIAEHAPVERFVYLEAEDRLPALESFESNPTGTPQQAIARRQNNCCGVRWSSNAQVLFENFTPGNRMTLRFEVPQSATYRISAVFTRAPDFGIYEFSVDGRPIGERHDGYAAAVERSQATGLGSLQLAAGTHTLTLTVADKNPASSNYFAGLDYFQLRTPGAAREPTVKPKPAAPGAGQTGGSATRPSAPPLTGSQAPGSPQARRRRAPRLSLRVNPAIDRRRPYRFTISGRLGLPAGVRPENGCQGRVAVQVKAGAMTISNRRTAVSWACTFSQRVSFAIPRRFAGRKRLTVLVRFGGNRFLLAKRAAVTSVRVR